jgi:hypothetical protein
MKNLLIAIGISLLLSSCYVTYIGDKFSPSASVDVFYSAHDVTKPYKVIGHMTFQNLGKDAVKDKFVKYGKSIGADAIVITGTESTSDGQSVFVNADALKYN